MARVFVVIPTLSEAGNVGRFARLGAPVVVADGGSDDGTPERARSAGLRVVESPPGRAAQMNAGAAAAVACGADVLLFLHADTTLPDDWQCHVAATLARPGTSAGAFRFALDAPGRRYRLLERLVRLRPTPYGDQAIFLPTGVFERAGGFPDWPILEDLELMRRVRRLGRVRLADAPAVTSARRWQRGGLLRTTLLNQHCLWAWRLGVDPRRIARWRSESQSREDAKVGRKGAEKDSRQPAPQIGI